VQAAVHATCQEVQVAIGPPTHHASCTRSIAAFSHPIRATVPAGDQHIRLSMMPLCEGLLRSPPV